MLTNNKKTLMRNLIKIITVVLFLGFIQEIGLAQIPPCTTPPTVTGNETDVTCPGENNGAINLYVIGGTMSFTTGNLVSNNFMWHVKH